METAQVERPTSSVPRPYKGDNRPKRFEASTPLNAQRPVRWEYRTDTLDNDADLMQYGGEGWELVSVNPVYPDVAGLSRFYFKRRMQQ